MKKKLNKKAAKANIAFGDAIRRLRTRTGLSQERLAELAGIHRNHVGDIERGDKEACLQTMLRICRALRVPLSALVLDMESYGKSRLSKATGANTGNQAR